MEEENRAMRNNWIERNSPPLICIFGFLFSIAVAYRILNQAGFKPGPESLNLLNDIILLGTALVLIWYTYETYKLREAAEKQIELQQSPLVIIEAQRPDALTVLNIGNSAAINIKIGVANDPSTVMIPLLKPGSGLGIGVDTDDGSLDTRARLRFFAEQGFVHVYALF